MENILHSLKAQLYPNNLTGAVANSYTARVVAERSLSVGDICQAAISRGGADISAPSMQHAIELFFKEMSYQMCDGYSVNINGYLTAVPQIQGVFTGPADKFDRTRHSLYFAFNQGDTLSENAQSIEVDILGVAETGPVVTQVTDVKTGKVNGPLTTGRNLKITGSKLKLVGDNAEVGVYFVNQATGERTKVDASDVATNNPSELMILTPDLATGSYTLEVKTQYTASTLLKEPRTAVFDKTLTVG